MRIKKMTTEELKLGNCVEEKYKWAMELVSITQSVIQLLGTILLSFINLAWHWVLTVWNNSQNLSYVAIADYLNSIWNNFTAIMTIEVISTETEGIMETHHHSVPLVEGRPIIVPTLRLNSQNIEDFYTNDSPILDQVSRGMDELILGSCFSGSSNYNSSDGEHDSGLVFTDPDENDSLDGVNSPSPPPPAIHIPGAGSSINNNNRRDSDSSDISSDGQDKDSKENSETTTKLIAQVESMFSNDHLAKDGFLLKHVRRRSDGFVSLKLVAGLRKVKQISRDFDVILNTLRKSEKLEINSEGTKIRRLEPLTQYLKSLPVAGNKDKENGKATDRQGHYNNGASSDSAQDDSRLNGKGHKNNNFDHKKIYRKDSNYSSCSSNPGSRNGSFSMPYQPGNEFLYRNMMVFPPGDEVPQQIVNRRRGGSLPMPMDQQYQHQPHYLNYYQQYQQHGHHGQRNSMHLVPNSSPPSGAGFHHRPKSNSYCEGTDRKNSISGMSLWLQRRQSANSRVADSNITVSVIRQPRGPDGTKGFARSG